MQGVERKHVHREGVAGQHLRVCVLVFDRNRAKRGWAKKVDEQVGDKGVVKKTAQL
jgi:hypothetical protein